MRKNREFVARGIEGGPGKRGEDEKMTVGDCRGGMEIEKILQGIS